MTFAQLVGVPGGSTGIIGVLNVVVVPVIITLAFVVFISGVIRYFFINGDEEGSRAQGREFVMWGLIGMVVLFSVWGLVNIVLSTLGISPGA